MKTSRDFWVLLTLIFLFVVGSILTIQTTAPQEQDKLFPRRTSYSARPGGTKAAYLLLNRLGFRADRCRTRLDKPPANAKVIFVIDILLNRMLSNSENLALENWTRAGGTLISYNGLPRPMPGQDDLSTQFVGMTSARIKPRFSTGYFKGVKSLQVGSNVRILAKELDAAGYTAALEDEQGVIVAMRKKGKGMAIAISDPSLVSNSGIGKADNAVFFANMVAAHARKGELVLFDEYHQGYGDDRTLAQIVGKYGRASFLQLLVVLVIGLYSYGRRFGEVRPAERPTGRVGFEFVDAMARLYRRAGARTMALETLCGSLRRDMAVALGMSDEARLDAIVRVASESWGMDRNALADVFIRCDQVKRSESGVTEAEMIRLAAEIQRFRKEAGIGR